MRPRPPLARHRRPRSPRLALSACGVTGTAAATPPPAAPARPSTGLRIMVPNTPGGGYDITARTAAKVMEDAEITSGVEVFNLAGRRRHGRPARLVNEKGNGKLAMQMGLGVVGASYTNKSKATLNETTPIAKLIEESGAIVVPKDSPYTDDRRPGRGLEGRPGHRSASAAAPRPAARTTCCPMQLAQAVGIDPKTVNFVVLRRRRRAAAGAARRQDRLRRLRRRRVPRPDRGRRHPGPGDQRREARSRASTRRPSRRPGIDLVFTNWRGIVAPPGITDADKRDGWIDAFDEDARHARSGRTR